MKFIFNKCALKHCQKIMNFLLSFPFTYRYVKKQWHTQISCIGVRYLDERAAKFCMCGHLAKLYYNTSVISHNNALNKIFTKKNNISIER